MKKIELLVSIAVFFITSNIYSQIISKIDVNHEIFRGNISVLEHTPFDIGNLSNVFDGEFETIARSANINPMVIIFSFSSPILLDSARILVGQNGSWRLEGANNLDDLNNQNGSHVLLCENATILENIYDEQPCANQYFQFLKATIHRTVGDNYVHLRELELIRSFDVSSICLVPKKPKLIEYGEHTMKIIAKDINGGTLEIQEFDLTSSNGNVLVDIIGNKIKIVGKEIGTATLDANFMGFTDNTVCEVLDDFELQKSEPVNVDVALVLQNSNVPSQGNLPFNQVFGWDDPVLLANQVASSLSEASGYTMNYNITLTFDSPFFTLNNGVYVDVDEFAKALIDNNTTYLDDNIFDYTGMLSTLNACELSNNGDIDEVWVYSVPYGGMYESRMAGENAFWINGPVIEDAGCVGSLPVMGFNYEREAALALHSYGHRFESTMKHLYGRWDNTSTDKNDYEIFTSFNLTNPNEGHVGNIHFPVNGTSDYDYGNTNYVNSYHTNWKRYPFIFNDEVSINCTEWDCTQMGYMTWWFSHIPKYKCLNKDRILNNWWHYVIDFDEAIEESQLIDVCDCNNPVTLSTNNYELKIQNFSISPNPVNNILSIELVSKETKTVQLQVVDLMGKILLQKPIECFAGENLYKIDVESLIKGFYFVNILNTNSRVISKKMIKN